MTSIWQKPLIHFDEDKKQHRKVSWLELFFDLFIVIVISQISDLLSANYTLSSLFGFVLLFIPTWWVWIGLTFYFERFETNGLEIKILTFLLMIPLAGMGIFAEHALTSTFSGFAFSYAFTRGIITVLWALGGIHNPIFRPVAKRFVTGFSTSFVLVIVSAILSNTISFFLFGLALFADLITPVFTIRHQAKLPRFSTSKLPERFGLFVIIVLGETLVSVIKAVSVSSLAADSVVAMAVISIATGFMIWWIYFDFIGNKVFKPGVWYTFFFSYLHMPLLMSIVATGSGLFHILSREKITVLNEHVNIQLLVSAMVLLFTGCIGLTLQNENSGIPDRSVFFHFISALLLILASCIIINRPAMISLLIVLLVYLAQIGYLFLCRSDRTISNPGIESM